MTKDKEILMTNHAREHRRSLTVFGASENSDFMIRSTFELRTSSFVAFVVLMVSGLLLSGCSPSKPAADGSIALTMWWWGEQDAPGLEKWVQDTIAKYEATHPNVTIEAILQGTEEVHPAFHAAAAAGEGPDIATLWYGGYMWEDVWSGHVTPISDYVSEEELSHWIGRKMSTFDDKVWAIDLYGYSLLMVYDKRLFAQAGLDPENPPETWEAFLDACEVLKQADITCISTGSADGWLATHLGALLFYQRVDGVKGLASAVTGKHSWTEPDLAHIWDRTQELIDKEYMNEDAPSMTIFEGIQQFRVGNAAMTFLSSNTAVAWMNELGEDVVGIMPAPSVTGESVDWVVTQGLSVFITEWSPHKEEAAEFLQFFHSPEVMADCYEQLKGTVLPADDRFDPSVIESPMVRKIWDMQYSGFVNNIAFTDGVVPQAILEDGLMHSVSEGLSPKEAAQRTQEAAQTWRDLSPESSKTTRSGLRISRNHTRSI